MSVSLRINTVVIGGSQAGLAAGYHLTRQGLAHVILDENENIGDTWRSRWDSLRLFTPGHLSSLPGMPFPGRRWSLPTKDQMAAYLQSYAERFGLPVRTGVKVDKVSSSGDGFEVTSQEERWWAQNVIVATGASHHPRIPSFASDLDGAIVQLHSSRYHSPSDLQEGGVLVVGAGNSGAEIALDLADHHRVWLSGRDTGHEPTRPGTVPDRFLTPFIWLMAHRLLTMKTPMGRKLRDQFLDPPRGIPLGRVRQRDIAAAGIERVPRTIGVRSGHPILEDDRVLNVTNVIWCTGFVADFGWIDLPVFDDLGWPHHDRGVVESQPGLYFMGLPFQYTLSSALIGGVGRDAEYIVRHIEERQPRPDLEESGSPDSIRTFHRN